jgi:predicted SAM-dependent methyltransferase
MKLNFGCGKNKLAGWQNYDMDVDIRETLPFEDGSADFIFAEHVVEHVTSAQAQLFFEECYRVLKDGGVMRITVPCITTAYKTATPEYINWVHRKRWSEASTKELAVRSLIVNHGHQALWTPDLLSLCIKIAGFENRDTKVGHSECPELRGIEGHGRKIGHAFNEIESICVEGVKVVK